MEGQDTAEEAFVDSRQMIKYITIVLCLNDRMELRPKHSHICADEGVPLVFDGSRL